MRAKSLGKEESSEGRPLVCPECGGDEFNVTCEVVATHLHLVNSSCGKRCFAFEVESAAPLELPEPTFECTNCYAELDLDAA